MSASVSVLPLTAAQQSIWLAHHLNPGAADYIMAECVEIHGPVDVTAFEAAVGRVLHEAEALRVRLSTSDDGLPGQTVTAPADPPMAFVDVSGRPDPVRAARAWMVREIPPTVDVCTDRLVSLALVRAADDHFFWYLRVHHILVDGAGAWLFQRRLAEVYRALAAGTEPAPSPFGSLRDLVAEDAEYRSSAQFQADRAYWTSHLAGQPDVVSLAGRTHDEPMRAVWRRTTQVPQSELDTMRAAARSRGTAWTRVFVAAVVAYLHRVTGAADLTVGIPLGARSGGATRNTPGMVSNVLPLRVTLSPATSGTELVGRVAGGIAEMVRHQRYRFEDLRRDLRLLADGRRLFGTQVNIMSFDYDLGYGEGGTTAHNLYNGLIEDLAVFVYQRADGRGLRVDFEANADFYTDEEVLAHQRRFLAFLGRFVGALDEPVRQLKVDERVSHPNLGNLRC